MKREKHTQREREVDSDSVREKQEERMIERLADRIILLIFSSSFLTGE